MVSRARTATRPARQAPEILLRKATLARTPLARAKYAERGLSHNGAVDRTTRAMLLRQLYLSHMEGRRFAEAHSVARQMLEDAVMPDVARQDAARACLGLGDRDGALLHLRIASRVSPPTRRAFHLWTLGSVLFLAGQYREAVGSLSRAARWGTTDKPLYRAQLALARRASGEPVGGLGAIRERLEEAPCGQGYGQFVIGAIAFEEKNDELSERYLSLFIQRTTTGRVALEVALSGEVAYARRLLRRIRARRRKAG
jgi:tetratricopeptide (TPR) repeat protein